MKNLVNRDIELLDSLPERLRYRFGISTKLKVTDYREGQRYRNCAEEKLGRLIKSIIHSNIGKNWNDIYSKLSAITKNVPYEFDLNHTINWYVERLIKSSIDGEYYMTSRYNKMRHFDSYLKSFNGSYHRDFFLYIDPVTNILKKVVAKGTKKPTTRKDHGRYVQKKKFDNLKRKRAEKEQISLELTELQLINKPEIHVLYRKLIREKNELLGKINKKQEEQPKIRFFHPYSYPKKPIGNPQNDLKQRMTWWKYMESERIKDKKKSEIKLISVLEQIERIQNGDYSSYFESNAYLYSIQKECHHFAQP